jgi:hypothetical protein
LLAEANVYIKVGALTGAEWGVHVSVVAWASSTGQHLPPASIFLKERFNPSLCDGAPPGTLQLYQESGYMAGELFVQWLAHVMSPIKPNVEERFSCCLTGIRATRICMLLNV